MPNVLKLIRTSDFKDTYRVVHVAPQGQLERKQASLLLKEVLMKKSTGQVFCSRWVNAIELHNNHGLDLRKCTPVGRSAKHRSISHMISSGAEAHAKLWARDPCSISTIYNAIETLWSRVTLSRKIARARFCFYGLCLGAQAVYHLKRESSRWVWEHVRAVISMMVLLPS